MSSIDWSNDAERIEFENDLEVHRAMRKNYSLSQWLQWFCGIVLLPALLVLAFYGPVGYTIVNDARKQMVVKEEDDITISFVNMTEDLDNTNVSYIPPGILDTVKLNYYFLTVPCQGIAFITAVAYHFTDYKMWNLLGTVVACLCLPVDMLIFYIEPIGFVGTLSAMVLGFVPFAITISDAVYPEKVVKVKDLKGNIHTVQKNSWTKHLSLTYNQRYNLVVRMTAAGYMFFATVALVITLVKGDYFHLITIYVFTEVPILIFSQRGWRTILFGNPCPGCRGIASATGSGHGNDTLAWGLQHCRPLLLHHIC